MIEFFKALFDPQLSFLRNAFLIALLGGVAFGAVGTFVVVRRISYIAGAIAHSILGGIGISLFLHYRWGVDWLHPMYGAAITALCSALLVGLVSMYARQREDTVIGAIWALGMAVGLLFLAATPGFIDPMSYLFGNILLISPADLWWVIGLDVVVVGGGVLMYNKLLAVCFDEEYSLLRGVPARLYYLLLLGMVALTVVLMVHLVGIVMVIALLTLPAAVAEFFSRRLWQMMVGAVVLSILLTAAGLAVSYALNIPTGATIIVAAGGAYLAGAGWHYIRRARS